MCKGLKRQSGNWRGPIIGGGVELVKTKWNQVGNSNLIRYQMSQLIGKNLLYSVLNLPLLISFFPSFGSKQKFEIIYSSMFVLKI